MQADMTITEYKKLRQQKLDEEWDVKYPDGMYYLITIRAGGAVWGHIIKRPTSHTQRVREQGSSAAGWGVYYASKDFYGNRALTHKTFKTREEWEAALSAANVRKEPA